jgi:hypothetical protein
VGGGLAILIIFYAHGAPTLPRYVLTVSNTDF